MGAMSIEALRREINEAIATADKEKEQRLSKEIEAALRKKEKLFQLRLQIKVAAVNEEIETLLQKDDLSPEDSQRIAGKMLLSQVLSGAIQPKDLGAAIRALKEIPVDSESAATSGPGAVIFQVERKPLKHRKRETKPRETKHIVETGEETAVEQP